MTYNPAKDAPRNLEEWNECVDYFYNQGQQKYQQEVAEAKAAARAAYPALPEKERMTLEAYEEEAAAYVNPAPTRAEIESTYAIYYPQPAPALEPPLTEAELFAQLRSFREVKLREYDEKIAQLERKSRLGEDVANELAAWDAYAIALCQLPEQEGAPWDGGGIETPWPVKPGAELAE